MMQAMLFRSRAADTHRVEQWVRDHYDEVWNFCRRRVGVTTAGDVTQETFLVAQKKGGHVAVGTSPRPFLYGIALRICMAHARRAKREVSFEWMEDLGSPSAEAGLLASESLRVAMQSLSAEHQEVVILHEIEGLTYDEIASVLGIPAGTVKSRLHHAFQRLRTLLIDPTENIA